MELSRFVCPACRAEHAEPAEAVFVLTALCLDCALEERYHEELASSVVTIKTAA